MPSEFRTVRKVITLSGAILALLLFPALPASAQNAVVNVPGTADIWLAGQGSGTCVVNSQFETQDCVPGQSPVAIPVLPGSQLQFVATGATGSCDSSSCTSPTPDGGGIEAGSQLFGGALGLSAINGNFNMLVGVFLTDAAPNPGATPPALDFINGVGQSFLTLSPQLQQVFFIGDGFTGTGTGFRQTFIVPPGATRLFLGSLNVLGTNNQGVGSISVNMYMGGQNLRPPIDCSQESSLRSITGDTETTMNFVNDTTNPVQVFWLNYQGQRVLYNGNLLPGTAFLQFTFLTHPWVITDMSGNCLQIFSTVSAPGVAQIKSPPAAPVKALAYVTNQIDNDVSVIDSTTNTETAKLATGIDPFGIITSLDSGRMYVTNAADNTVSVFDIATTNLLATVPVGLAPTGVAVTPDGRHAYVANDADTNMSVFDTSTFSPTALVDLQGNVPFWMLAGHDGTRMYATVGLPACTDTACTGISVVDTGTNLLLTTIPVGLNILGADITPDGHFLWAADSIKHGVVWIADTTTNTVSTSVPVGNQPRRVLITPDGTRAYVSNIKTNNVYVIDTTSHAVLTIIPVGNVPKGMAITPDGTLVYTVNQGDDTVSEIDTVSNLVIGTAFAGNFATNAAISTAPITITQPLSPTALNTFTFPTHVYKNQYPAGTNFSGVTMTVTAFPVPQDIFKAERLAGTPFSNANCIVYGGTGGNCIVYAVSCTPSPCPSSPTGQPDISILTSYDTSQVIVNPGFLEAPEGTNNWTNVFTDFFQQRIDPTTKGGSSGFSDWVAVDLGVDPSTGPGNFQGFLPPLAPTNPRTFESGDTIPVKFRVTNAAGQSIPNVKARLSVQFGTTPVTVQNANCKQNGDTFRYKKGPKRYQFHLSTDGYQPGNYTITVFSNSFPIQTVTFTIQADDSRHSGADRQSDDEDDCHDD